LTAALAGADPLAAIQSRVGTYWVNRLQSAVIATMGGVFKYNETATDAFHTINDLTNDVKGASFQAGVTNFTAEGFVDTLGTMGDSLEDLGMVIVHSTVYLRMIKGDLIDFIKDSTGTTRIPFFMNRRVIVDDRMPSPSTNVFETWIFGAGALLLGTGTPDVPTEIDRKPDAGTGGGQSVLHSRLEWAIHPEGYKFKAASIANGGPGNGTGVNDLNNAASWQRARTQRKQIKIARFITREA
jgi:hypothetical protein